ncbi:methylenetetrahydrofolate reductase [NAD(P)H] [Alcaligenes endophyticus]|uniref:Methylenetetrahydrofolate reductase n=1 Tax=Alcaligenes endophyticus TaxID=1929088 RepID=A0ABT8EGB0_9BURK|nr:methylenetetrahydrofolate reductase [NAD(P)H] [Alcaligenes endophyticus]MCX5590026.1 methylenetetrahydrofolate reductase [NAD(P)H] [Alcaligenes endophyticus]MDN4120311.1 methylenetetrahydrofolate reductase [NAD(P)H] [Alcaligenes endophyticus]
MTTKQTLSLEFFPPRDTEAQEKLVRSAKTLQSLRPAYVSVTFGAGGSTRSGTSGTVRTLQNLGFDVAPHLSCMGAGREELTQLLDEYQQVGVKRIVALRGDLPSGMGGVTGELRYASDLVKFIREYSGDTFHLEVAAYPEMHPEANSLAQDIDHFVHKVKAGANSAITQYFFNAQAYFDFVARVQARGLDIPITPGIMPITNSTQLLRFSNMCGADVPRWIRQRLADFGDDRASIRAFGIDVVSRLCQDLLDGGAPGLHMYTLNGTEASLGIVSGLSWR